MNTPETTTQIVIYQQEGQGVEVRLEAGADTVWLTQRQMGELFDTTPENVLMHLQNVYRERELDEPATAKDFLVVQTEGKRKVRRSLKHYNLDTIISVGYRVSSKRAKKGVFITTVGFTKEAEDFASFIDSRIILIDGTRLVSLMVDHNVGVTTVGTYEVKKIDTDYFEGE